MKTVQRLFAGVLLAAAGTISIAVPAEAAPVPAAATPVVRVAALPAYATWISDVTAVAGDAGGYLADRLPDPSVRAALVLDIDNTSLQTTYRPGITSPAVGPILDVARQAKADGAAVFFVTARPQILGWQSEANLRGVGFPFDGIYLRPWFNTQPDQALKTDARRAIEGRGYRIVANIGNNTSDLEGGVAERTFKLPDYDGQLS